MNVFQSNAAFPPSNPLYPDPYIVMPSGDLYALWCVVYGNPVPFRVFVNPDVDVEFL